MAHSRGARKFAVPLLLTVLTLGGCNSGDEDRTSQATCIDLFREGFETGLGQWERTSWDEPPDGMMFRTSASAFQGTFSATFDAVTSGEFAPHTFKFAVTPGETHTLTVAYRTLGGGGYIGINKYDCSSVLLGEQWLIGDGGDTSNLSTWDCNVTSCPDAAKGVWTVYTQSYTIPLGVCFIDIKIEDAEDYLPDDSAGKRVFFDSIHWCPPSSAALPFFGDAP